MMEIEVKMGVRATKAELLSVPAERPLLANSNPILPGLLVAPSGGWGTSTIPPLSGDKQTSGEPVATGAFDL
jgi:hypothetical protein